MGVNKFYDLIKNGIQSVPISQLIGKKIIIDANIILYKIAVEYRDDKRKRCVKKWEDVLNDLYSYLKNFNIISAPCLFVFDGSKNDKCKDVRKSRNSTKEEYFDNKLWIIIEKVMNEIRKYSSLFSCTIAPYQADPYIIELYFKLGYDFVLSTDSDFVIYGANVVKNTELSSSYPNKVIFGCELLGVDENNYRKRFFSTKSNMVNQLLAGIPGLSIKQTEKDICKYFIFIL